MRTKMPASSIKANEEVVKNTDIAPLAPDSPPLGRTRPTGATCEKAGLVMTSVTGVPRVAS